VGGEFAGRGSGRCRGDHRVAAPGWLVVGNVPLRGKSGGLVWIVLGRRGAATGPRGGAGGAGDTLAKKDRARYCLAPMEACSPVGWARKPWTRMPAATGQG
jgi:hypothetical protein